MELTLTLVERRVCEQALARLHADLAHLVSQLKNTVLLGSPVPPALSVIIGRIDELVPRLQAVTGPHPVVFRYHEEALRLLRAALAHERRVLADEVQSRQQLVTNQALTENLQATLAPIDDLLSGPLRDIIPERVPRLADYVSPHGLEVIQGARELQVPIRDPKHQVLLSSSLLKQDLEVLRSECEDRGRPLAVVFIDLDDFRAFNVELGEVVVDRSILPAILGAVEASAYGHGRAYRHGGDEFVLLLPNSDDTLAVGIAKQLKSRVEALSFGGLTATRPSVSAGIWITVPESHLTAAELVDMASQAKKRSKDAGRSRITLRQEVGSGYNESVTSNAGS